MSVQSSKLFDRVKQLYMNYIYSKASAVAYRGGGGAGGGGHGPREQALEGVILDLFVKAVFVRGLGFDSCP